MNTLDRTLLRSSLSGLAFGALSAAEAAAIGAADQIGRGDEMAADQAAVDAMRAALNAIDMKGEVVIGEGERDSAAMLFIGEKVGTGRGPEIAIALDPLEGTTLAAKAMPNALTVIAMAPKGTLFRAPDVYMDKIACGPGLPPGVVDLDADAATNIRELAKAKQMPVRDVTVCVLDRPRHAEIIADIRATGARLFLISDGDVAGVINTAQPEVGIDLYLGRGGAPEGVLAAVAMKCVGGQFQGRLMFRDDSERARARKWGISDLNRKYELQELVTDDAVFAASGVTDGTMLNGVRVKNGMVSTQSLLMCALDHSVRKIDTTRLHRL